MVPTWIGAILLLAGLALLYVRNLNATLLYIFFASLFGGSAAIQLPALGGSSIAPAYLALGIGGLQLMLIGRSFLKIVFDALTANLMLTIFCLYGSVTAFILPHLFAHTIYVMPLQAKHPRFLFETFPLHFSSQNITTSVYLLGTLAAAIFGWAVGKRWTPGRLNVLNLLVFTAWLHVLFGLIVLGLDLTGKSAIVDIVRNGNYAQLTNEFEGFSRITGFFPEASSFASYAMPFVFALTEAWLRNLRPRWTGPAVLALIVMLVMSTSSTAYVSLGAGAVLLLLRCILFPSAIPTSKLVKIAIFGIVGVSAGIVIAALSPKAFDALSGMVQHMTVDKATSSSGQQRRFWAAQGWTAFKVSRGLGVGAGTFRSSSLGAAILGSCGVVGFLSFLAYCVTVLRPTRASTYGRGPNPLSEQQAVGVCLGWGIVGLLIPAMIDAPSPDPGLMFGLLAGLAVAARGSVQAQPLSNAAPRFKHSAPATVAPLARRLNAGIVDVHTKDSGSWA